jgi:ketosteroid isomerase-like protein
MPDRTGDLRQESHNKALVQASFDRWRAGEGSPFELLATDTEWTIVGSSPLSKTYRGRRAFIDNVIAPFNARMMKPLVPSVRGLYADGDTVVAFFDAAGTARDGRPYSNTYTWYLQIKADAVIRVVAFFDTRIFDELRTRVSPLS